MGENVKEITIESYPGYFSRIKFEDKLKISSSWISYKKQYFNFLDSEDFEEEDVKWDYKTTSKEFSSLFDSLCNACLYYSKKDHGDVLDAGGYTITIKMLDNSKKELHFDYVGFNPEDEELQHIFHLIRKMIPQTEKLPFYLSHQSLEDIHMDIEKLDEIIAELEKKPKLDVYKGYPKWVWTMICGLLERDFEYTPTFDRLVKPTTDLSELSFEEIKTFVTGMARAEHWCEGGVIQFVENGSALKVMKRLRELLEVDEE